jgi:hypothetical protein
MLDTPVDKVIIENGRATGIESKGEKAFARVIIADPSYFSGIAAKTRVIGKIVRAICLLKHPPVCIKAKLDSANIIIPQNEVGRSHDVYICSTSYQQRVCPRGWYIALVSTAVETETPLAELKVGLDLLGPVQYKAEAVHSVFEPVIKGAVDGLYCSSSYDPTTRFETTIAEVPDLFQQITGSPVNFDTTGRRRKSLFVNFLNAFRSFERGSGHFGRRRGRADLVEWSGIAQPRQRRLSATRSTMSLHFTCPISAARSRPIPSFPQRTIRVPVLSTHTRPRQMAMTSMSSVAQNHSISDSFIIPFFANSPSCSGSNRMSAFGILRSPLLPMSEGQPALSVPGRPPRRLFSVARNGF